MANIYLGSGIGTHVTGQTTSYADYDDGYYEKGKTQQTRFLDIGDGTVLDTFTNIYWLKVLRISSTLRTWSDALSDCAALANGSAGLTDGSSAGDWRMPNAYEAISLMSYNQNNPAYLNTSPFNNSSLNVSFWTSTICSHDTSKVIILVGNYGYLLYAQPVSGTLSVFPIKGGA